MVCPRTRGRAARDRPPPAVFVGGVNALARPLEQAHLVILLPGVGVTDPDHFAFRLFAEILGGGMSSRLFQAVRERLGLVYAIDAYLEAHADAGVLGVYAGAAASNAGKAAVRRRRESSAHLAGRWRPPSSPAPRRS